MNTIVSWKKGIVCLMAVDVEPVLIVSSGGMSHMVLAVARSTSHAGAIFLIVIDNIDDRASSFSLSHCAVLPH